MNVPYFIARKTFGSFRHSFVRSILNLAIVVTSVGLAIMVVAQSIFSGFQKEISNKVFGFWGHIHVTDLSVHRSIEPIMISLSPGIIDSIEQIDIDGKKVIDRVHPFVILPSIIGRQYQSDGLFFKGVDRSFDWAYMQPYIERGRAIHFPDSGFSREILLSEQTASRLGVDTGQSVIAHFVIDNEYIKRKLHVCGLYKTGLEEYDRKFAILDMAILQSLLKVPKNYVTGLEIKCNDLSKVEKLNDLLYNEILPAQWYSETIRQKFPNIFEWLALQETNKYFILGMILIVCIINMATVLLVLILERSHMIGILQTLGMARGQLRMIFMIFGGRIILYSLGIGNFLGLGMCYIQARFKIIRLSEADYYLSYAPVDLGLWPVLLLNLIVFIAIWVSLLLPVTLVQKIQPVTALKFR